MYIFVTIVFVFGMGSIFGWGLEVVYRHYKSPDKKWVNPGFCVGPWLPIYGVGVLIAYFLTALNVDSFIENDFARTIVLFVIISLCMTTIELIGGILLFKCFNLRLWDYRMLKFNYKGFICLRFSIYWMILGAIYYFLIHPKINESVIWLSHNIIFSFFVGAFFSLFVADVIYSSNVITKVRKYAIENGIIVMLEDIKDRIRREQRINESKITFFTFMLKENLSKIITGDIT